MWKRYGKSRETTIGVGIVPGIAAVLMFAACCLVPLMVASGTLL